MINIKVKELPTGKFEFSIGSSYPLTVVRNYDVMTEDEFIAHAFHDMGRKIELLENRIEYKESS